MSRRKTVKLNIDFLLPLIKNVCRSNIVFCEKMGRSSGQWVSDWQRKDESGNPAPRNLPSPEEAARMCALLKTTPEEILTEQADIDLVKGLLDNEMAKKEAPATEGEGVSPTVQELFDFIDTATDTELNELLRYAQFLMSKR